MTEDSQDEVKFKSLGFHRELADIVSAVIREHWLKMAGRAGDDKCSWLFVLYEIVMSTFVSISREGKSEIVETFQQSWKEIDRTHKGEFGLHDIEPEEASLRFKALMKYLMDSGLTQLGIREENWEDAFVDTLEEKMEREE